MQDDQIILVTPVVTKEDIDQEMELLRLQGKNPSRAVVYRKFSRFEGLLFDSIGTPDIPGAEPVPWAGDPIPSLEVMTQLVGWALEQSIQIQQAVLSFLEGRSNEKETLDQLISLGVISRSNRRYMKATRDFSYTMTDVILKKFEENGEVDIYDLYQSAREFLSSKRPEAAVRQIVRRLIRLGVISKVGDHVYRISG